MQGVPDLDLLRPGLLSGVGVAVAGPAGRSAYARAVEARCADLGAGAERDVLVWDGAGAFASAAEVDAVLAALDGAWPEIRPMAESRGKVLLLAPPPGDEHAEAARAGLENLARTLSIEWSRFGVRLVALRPGTDTAPGEVAELAAFLASRAGDYYSGCVFDLGGG